MVRDVGHRMLLHYDISQVLNLQMLADFYCRCINDICVVRSLTGYTLDILLIPFYKSEQNLTKHFYRKKYITECTNRPCTYIEHITPHVLKQQVYTICTEVSETVKFCMLFIKPGT